MRKVIVDISGIISESGISDVQNTLASMAGIEGAMIDHVAQHAVIRYDESRVAINDLELLLINSTHQQVRADIHSG